MVPVWSQRGTSTGDNSRNYRNLAPTDEKKKLWRITCFVVDKNYRGSGVAGAGLKAVLEGIRNNGWRTLSRPFP